MNSEGRAPTRKQYSTIGCCGIDCGLCPRYYTVGGSRCPGCYGPGFSSKHPSCGFITCCVKQRGFEVCAQCGDFPCARFNGWDTGDSFVTHACSLENLHLIKRDGISIFLEQQAKRMALLKIMLNEYDDGRSRSFYCLSATMLPLDNLDTAMQEIRKTTGGLEIVKKALALRESIEHLANTRGVVLTLRKKERGR